MYLCILFDFDKVDNDDKIFRSVYTLNSHVINIFPYKFKHSRKAMSGFSEGFISIRAASRQTCWENWKVCQQNERNNIKESE